MTAAHIPGPATFPRGKTLVLPLTPEIGIELSALAVAPGGEHSQRAGERETVAVLVEGGGVMETAGLVARVQRQDTFAWGFRGGADGALLIVAQSPADVPSDPILVDPDTAALRGPRTVGTGAFERRVWDLAAGGSMIVGETVAAGWSGYPPHHHPQPEVYFYRFQPPQGFGFAQLGEEAAIVGHNSVAIIRPDADHAQASAPGYTQYYLWIIRNPSDRPYAGPSERAEHAWVLGRGC
jgi:5-deoxy-glucuronate isomerase